MTGKIALRVTAVTPFGVEIDIDLALGVSAEIIGEIRALYRKHHLLVFRNQALTHERQIDFAANFGPVLRSEQDGVGYISNQPEKGGLGTVELAFHSDLAFSPEPFLGICLHAIDVEDDRSSTRYVDSCIAYRTLPDAMKARIQDLHALHVFAVDQSGPNTENIAPDMPRAIRPLVMTHPQTGESILYMNFNQTARIVELSADDSAALIRELFAHLYRPNRIYDHRWRNGDLILWDNLATQHARGDVSAVGRRTLQRVVLASKGFFEQHPQFAKDAFITHAAL